MSYVLEEFKWGEAVIGTPSGVIPWAVDWTGLQYDTELYTLEDFQVALQASLDAWEGAAAVDFTFVGDLAVSDLDISFVSLHGPVVGEAETWFTPNRGAEINAVDYSYLRFDSTEQWDPFGVQDLDFAAVALHELGHVLGLGHTTDDSQIMFEKVTDIDELGSGDIAGVQILYGIDEVDEPVEDPGADPEPVASGGGGIGAILGMLLAALALLMGGFGGAGGAVVAAMRGEDDADEDDPADDTADSGHLTDLSELLPVTAVLGDEPMSVVHSLSLEEEDEADERLLAMF